nr:MULTISPECIES: DHHW family protein [unclassified Ruminococcus]
MKTISAYCIIIKSDFKIKGGIIVSDYNHRRRDDRNDRNYDERYIKREERRRKERLKKRRRNRIIIVTAAIAILVAIVLILIFSINSCLSCSGSSSATNATKPTSAATEPPTEKASNSSVKEIADNGKEGQLDEKSSLYFWDNKAFELFYGSNNTAKNYADTINSLKETLGSDITVYNMVVPNHSEFGLCPREANKVKTEQGVTSQRDNTTAVYKNLSKDIKPVDVYDSLNSHKTEYIYFNTDHHWTGLGSYYAYTTFAKAAGITPLQLTAMQKSTIENFLGSFYTSSQSDILKANPDYVDYYTFSGYYICKLFTQGNSDAIDVGMYNENIESDSSAYEVFLWGDNPLTVIDNPDIASGNKIALVKDSYGSAFAPYLAYNYDEVHVIDFRYFDGNLAEYCNANGIKNVLFLNSIMSANDSTQLTAMKTLISNSGTGSYNTDSTSTIGGADSSDYQTTNSSDETYDDSSTNENTDGNYSGDSSGNDYTDDEYSYNDDSGYDNSSEDYSYNDDSGNDYSGDDYSYTNE